MATPQQERSEATSAPRHGSPRRILNWSRCADWFHQLSPMLRSALLLVTAAVLTAVIGIGALLAFFAWDDHQFKNGPYCRSEPADPLC